MRDCALVAMLERRKIAIVAAIAAVASAKGRGAPSGAPSSADAEKKKVTDELMNWVKDVDPTKAPVKCDEPFLAALVVILVLLGAAYNFFLAPKPVGVKYVPR